MLKIVTAFTKIKRLSCSHLSIGSSNSYTPSSSRRAEGNVVSWLQTIWGSTLTLWLGNFALTSIPKSYSSTLLLLLLSRFSRVQLCETPETAAHQAPPSLGFSRQEHWSGLPFPSPIHESEKWKWSRSVVSDSSKAALFCHVRLTLEIQLLHFFSSVFTIWSSK